jgi:hypothetical protein
VAVTAAGTPPPPDDGRPGPAADGVEAGRRTRLGNLRREAAAAAGASARTAATLAQAAAAVHLEVTATGLAGDRVLLGHVVGLHQELRAGGLHGPRQVPAVVYVFADALAVRPSDDAPMSSVPLLGLHLLLPPLAVTHWLYKAGRTEHAEVDLVEVAAQLEAALPHWTADDLGEADPKVQVLQLAELDGPAYLYAELGFAHLVVPTPGGPPHRLRSTLPATPEAFARLWELCAAARWPGRLQMTAPAHGDQGGPAAENRALPTSAAPTSSAGSAGAGRPPEPAD